MEMYQVRYFLAVAEHLNFTRAAEQLNVAQPSLTRAVQKLEDELGGPLFHRERRNTHLTELGRMMRPHLEASLFAAQAAKREATAFQKRETGLLNLGVDDCVSMLRIAPLLQRLSQDISGLELNVTVATHDEVVKLLLAGTVDAAMLTAQQNLPDRLDTADVFEEPYAVAAPAGHRFLVAKGVTLEELDGEMLLVREDCVHARVIAEAMDQRMIARNERHRSNDQAALACLVKEGLGCLVLPASAAALLGLETRPLLELEVTHRVVLATAAGRRHSPAIQMLLKLVEERPN